MTCQHCWRTIARGPDGVWRHQYGPSLVLIWCAPHESRQPYGLEAEPSEEEG